MNNNFLLIFLLSFLSHGIFGADEVKVTERDPVTLQTGLTETKSTDQIHWLYGADNTIIAEISKGIFQTYDDRSNGIFKDKLKLNKTTGSLTINDIRIKNSGVYEVNIRGSSPRKFSVKVYARLPTPEIVPPPCVQKLSSSSSPKCAFTCSVQTSEQTSLTWYKGSSSVSSKISDICSTLSLQLEVDYGDENYYSCVVKNDVSNQTTVVDIKEYCQICADSGLSPGAVTGIIFLLLILFAVVALFSFRFYRHRISELKREKKIHTAERENVTLKTEAKLLEGDEIQWWFSNKNILIAEIIEGIGETYVGPDKRFRDSLELDKETGSLTIKNIRCKHAGDYRLKIIKRRGETSNCNFSVHIKEEKMLVSHGESVTLKADAEIQREDEVQWLFHIENCLIAKMTRNTREITYPDKRFKDTLKLDKKTGSLTINNIEDEHAGLYKLKIISRGEATYKTFTVYFQAIIQEEPLFEGRIGKSVTLKPYIEIQRNNEIQWMIGDQDRLIAKMTRGARKITYYDERFRDRLVLDEKTGSLTINNITIEDIREYKLKIISSSGTTVKKFRVLIKGEPSFFCEGDTAVLQCAADIQTDEIEWRFEGEESPIAEVKGGQIIPYNGPNRRFRDRLEVDKSNGSLIIKNIGREHEGLYKLKRKSSSTADRVYAFTVTLCDSIIVGWVGKSVTLKPDTEEQRNYKIMWMIEDRLIATMTRGAREKTYLDERFRDRLVLDKETGSLTINNITIKDNRDYKLRIISSSGTTVKKFGVLTKGVPMSFNEGDRAVLQCAAEIQTDEIEWRFKSVESPIAEVKGGKIILYNGPNRRFRDGLKIDEKTGSLIISNIRREHEGLYQLMKKSSSTGDHISAFDVMVYGSRGNQVNDSVTEESPLLHEDDQNVVYENERMSSL